MFRLPRLFALLVVLMMLPGVREVVEQAGHWAVSGHSSHAATHDEGDAKPNGEDDCAGAMHFCHCCRVPIDVTAMAFILPIATGEQLATSSWLTRSGVPAPAFRPPLA